jgi:hypothetical protein
MSIRFVVAIVLTSAVSIIAWESMRPAQAQHEDCETELSNFQDEVKGCLEEAKSLNEARKCWEP